MPIDLRPPGLVFDAAGVPYSRDYGDVYHSRDSGPGQSRHVFLHGSDLPARWRGTRTFTIVETGFGTGLNFLVAWAAWRDDPQRCGRLHFVSIERHPLGQGELATVHERYPEVADLAARLRAAWPPALPGLHRLDFGDGDGGVTLTLAFADVETAARELRLAADAFYLDGFAPERNPRMWSPQVMKALARVARVGATVATYTTARAVRDALATAGFACARRPGFASKRHMLAGRYAPAWQPRHAPPVAHKWPSRRALIIGAGMAGAAVAAALARRGWEVTVLEQAAAAASGASGMHAGAFQPHVSVDDGLLSRAIRAGFLSSLRRWRALAGAGAALAWDTPGALALARDDAHAAQMADALARLALPPDFARHVSQAEASQLAGAGVAAGGCWFPGAGWMSAPSLVRAQLAVEHARIRLQPHRAVAQLRRGDGGWQALDADGATLGEAPVIVLASGHDALRLADFATAALAVRGQVTLIPAPPLHAPRCVVGGDGYLLPAVAGLCVAGASYDRDDHDPLPDAASREGNLARVERLLPGSVAGLDHSTMRDAVAFRSTAPDRLPMAGCIPDAAAARDRADTLRGAHLADLPRLPGLYAAFGFGSRGLVWSALAAEIVACDLDGEPAPVEGPLLDAMDPGRFVVKRLRHGTL